MAVDLTPYGGVRAMMGTLPTWLGEDDAIRIEAYSTYEAMYWSSPGAYKLTMRGSEQNPVYVPSAMTLIEAKNRFLCKDWTFAPDPMVGSDAEKAVLELSMRNLFKREQVWAKFATQKRYGLIRGDAIWHIVADPLKLPGTRVSVYEVDPAAYFPILDPGNDERVIGCHLVEQWETPKNTIIKRQTYRKTETGSITYEMSWWEQGKWDDREGGDLKPADEPPTPPVPEYELPPLITSIPVYHIKNSRTPGFTFGNSELRGMERSLVAISQAISDEELALALDGIGMYVTTSGPPVNDDGDETNWNIGPGYVAEIDPDATWQRVQGVTSVQAVQDHVKYLEKAVREASGVPDIAIGYVDAQVAESGIALALKFAPILAANAEKEQEILSITDHMLFDLTRMWLPAFEQVNAGASAAVSIVNDPLPVDRAGVLAEVTAMVTAGFITLEYGRSILSEKLGYDFPDEMGATVVTEQAELAKARNPDPFASRIIDELNDATA